MRHKIVVGAMVALLTSVMAASVMAQAAPQAIQGSVTSVGDNKASFGVTVKNTEVKVPVTPATRYALDDTASDFATAVVVGRDVNVIMTGDGNAYIVMATSVPAKGTVKMPPRAPSSSPPKKAPTSRSRSVPTPSTFWTRPPPPLKPPPPRATPSPPTSAPAASPPT